MDSSDKEDALAFWAHLQRHTGNRFASWPTFSAYFLTYMEKHYPGEAERGRTAPSTEMVLRYAFDRGSPARAESIDASKAVYPTDLSLFLQRFGPMRSCLVKASRSLFDDEGCLERWFHGNMSRDDAAEAIRDWEVSRVRRRHGVFLFRYTPNRAQIAFSYRRRTGEKVQHSLISNGAAGYYLPKNDQQRVWANLREFINAMDQYFVHPVTSDLHEECSRELQEPQEMPEPPVDQIARARILFQNAQALTCGGGAQTIRVLREALEMVTEVLSIIGGSELGAPQLEVKALRSEADILWQLEQREDGVKVYERYLELVAQVQEDQEATADGSSPVSRGALLYVHRLLAIYYLGERVPSRALYHFSELIACTTDEDPRRKRVEEFHQMEEFRNATARLTHGSVEEMLAEGITYFRREEYAPAAEKFEKALRDARCIGEGKLEARALGNVATVDFKTHRIPAAIRRYRTCVQLLRQLRDQVTERKILNYLVMCCIEAQRWTPAKLFHEQLSLLAESNENIEHLRKLWAKIQEGISAQVAEEAARASSGPSRVGEEPSARSVSPPPPGRPYESGVGQRYDR